MLRVQIQKNNEIVTEETTKLLMAKREFSFIQRKNRLKMR